MKYKFILLNCALLAPLFMGNAQSSSLFFNKIYEGKDVKPLQSIPAWSEFSTNSEGAKTTLSENGNLSVKINENTSFGYRLPLSSTSITASPFAIEFGLQTPTDNAGMDLDIRTPEGDRATYSIQKQFLINRIGNDTILRNLDNSQLSAFRFVLDTNKKTLVYKNGELLTTQDRTREDEIKDPGFENSNQLGIWWASSWSQVVIDGNSPHSGSKSIHWENGWTGQLGANFPVQPNSKYRLSYWAKAVKVNASQSVMKGGLWVAGVNKGSLNITPGNYQKFTIEFTTGSNEEIAELVFHNGWDQASSGAFAVYIDDVELTQLEGEPYIQFGKIAKAKTGDFLLNYIAAKADNNKPALSADLTTAISDAEALKSGAITGSGIGNFPQYAVDRLQNGLSNAKEINADQSYILIDAAYAKLQREIDRFNNCKITNASLDFSTLNISPNLQSLKLADRVQLRVSGKMNDNKDIDTEVLFISYKSENNKISIDANGILTAKEIGVDELTVTAQYINATKTLKIPIEVKAYEITAVNAAPFQAIIRLGDATGINITALMTNDEAAKDGEITFTYESLTPAIASVNTFGTIIGKTAGTAQIKTTGSFMGKEISKELEVEVIGIDRIEITAPQNLNKDVIGQYTVKAFYTDGTEANLAHEDVAVYSSNRDILRVDNKGLVVACNLGEATLTARIKQATTLKTQSATVSVGDPQGVSNATISNLCKIYPNPAQENVCISIPEDSQFTTVSIISLTGSVLLSQNIATGATISLSISDLAPGIYFVSLTGNDAKTVEKLIIK